jgi:hypothetical protein
LLCNNIPIRKVRGAEVLFLLDVRNVTCNESRMSVMMQRHSARILLPYIVLSIAAIAAVDTDFGWYREHAKEFIGECPELDYDIGDDMLQIQQRAMSFSTWHHEQCQHNGASPIKGASGIRCTASRCSNFIRPLLERIHANHTFKACQLIIVTSIYGGHDHLLSATTTQYPNITCFVAFLDEASFSSLKGDIKQSFLRDGMVRGWKVLLMPLPASIRNTRVKSRVWKTLLPQLFPLQKWSVWVDAKHRLVQDPWVIIKNLLVMTNSSMAFASHFLRYNFAEEQETVVHIGLVTPQVAAAQRDAYYSQGMTRQNTGMVDGAVILRDHQSTAAHLVSCLWWRQLLMFPPRDQTSMPFILHQLGFKANITHEGFAAAQKVYKKMLSISDSTRWLQTLSYQYTSSHVSPDTIHVFPYCQLHRIAIQQSHRAAA